MNSRYPIPKSWILYLALIAAKKNVKSGKNIFVKRNIREMKRTWENSVSYLNKLLKRLTMKNLRRVLSLTLIHTVPIISSTIISIMGTINNNNSSNLTSPPLRAVRDQHRPHLNTLLEEPSNLCLSISSRLRLTLIIRLKYKRIVTYLRYKKKKWCRRCRIIFSMRKIRIRYTKYTG